jgi:hypothetical protein
MATLEEFLDNSEFSSDSDDGGVEFNTNWTFPNLSLLDPFVITHESASDELLLKAKSEFKEIVLNIRQVLG